MLKTNKDLVDLSVLANAVETVEKLRLQMINSLNSISANHTFDLTGLGEIQNVYVDSSDSELCPLVKLEKGGVYVENDDEPFPLEDLFFDDLTFIANNVISLSN